MKTEELPGVTLATDGHCLMVTGENIRQESEDYESLRIMVPLKNILSFSLAKARTRPVWFVWIGNLGAESLELIFHSEHHASEAMRFIREALMEERDCKENES